MAEVMNIYEIIEKKIGVKPEATHKIVYDSAADTLEPIYFWTLDLMNDFGLKPEKLIDNFMSSPGSGHFGEMGQRASVMQQQGAATMERVNAILRSVLNLIYDLKEFKVRLQSYSDLKDPIKKESAILSLKQIWLDKVDINKQNSSIKAMAMGITGFQTLLDAFMFAKTVEDAQKIDLNERVKKILVQRVYEFNNWLKESETELRKRYQLERNYLKSQVNSLKLYSRWAKPYLKASMQLEQKEGGRNPALVKSFSTTIFELTLLGKTLVKLPPELSKVKTRRNYYACILVDFNFRGIPQKVNQRGDFAFGGRTEITFRGYALNEDELQRLEYELDKSDIGDVLGLIEGATTESLGLLQKEIDDFLDEKEQEEKGETKKVSGENPFSALLGLYNKKIETKPKKEEDKRGKPIKKDDWVESNHLRKIAKNKAASTTFTIYDIYKKAHGMPSYA